MYFFPTVYNTYNTSSYDLFRRYFKTEHIDMQFKKLPKSGYSLIESVLIPSENL